MLISSFYKIYGRKKRVELSLVSSIILSSAFLLNNTQIPQVPEYLKKGLEALIISKHLRSF
jgi:hypothetical protein